MRRACSDKPSVSEGEIRVPNLSSMRPGRDMRRFANAPSADVLPAEVIPTGSISTEAIEIHLSLHLRDNEYSAVI